MSQSNQASRVGRTAALAAAVSGALALGACGGGNNDAGPPGPAEAVPATATASVAGLIRYLEALTAIQDDTLIPIDVSGITLPTDDSAPPTPI